MTLLIDITSKGGNLLLDVGPTHDGSLSHIQEQRLHDLANWMEINAEGIWYYRLHLQRASVTMCHFLYLLLQSECKSRLIVNVRFLCIPSSNVEPK